MCHRHSIGVYFKTHYRIVGLHLSARLYLLNCIIMYNFIVHVLFEQFTIVFTYTQPFHKI